MVQLAADLRRYHPRHPLAQELAQMTLPQMISHVHDIEDEAGKRRTAEAIQAAHERLGGF